MLLPTLVACLLFGGTLANAALATCPQGEDYNSYTGECEPVPVWTIPENEDLTVCFDQTWATGGKAHVSSQYSTCVSMSYTATHINLNFQAFNDNVQMNAYGASCNADMWNQEVVEMFITDDMVSAKPEHYYEIEMSPTNGNWLSFNDNPGGDRANLTHVLVDCNKMGFAAAVEVGPSQWNRMLSVPRSLISDGKSNQFRANFFRVQMHDEWRSKDRHDIGSSCSAANCTFLCANCPSTAEPDFHHSGFFGILNLGNGTRA
jgi:hypothetical protein